MKMAFLRNLQGTETLAKDIFDGNGDFLLKAGCILTPSAIKLLKREGVFLVTIEDYDLADIVEDTILKELKYYSMEQLPKLFNDIACQRTVNFNVMIDTVSFMVDYILSQNTVNTNFYEVETFDNYTYIHCIDTAIMSIYLGSSLKFDKEKLKNLAISALLHDVGKMMIPQKLLNKPRNLSHIEYEITKKHVIYSKLLLQQTNLFSQPIIDGVAHHHERLDGSGYPYRLKGEAISEFGRIIALCDVFTAMSSNRSYRDRFSPNDAYEYILSGSGTLFDANYVNSFRTTFSIYPLGCCVRLSNGIEGYVIRQNSNFPDRPVIRVIYNHINKERIIPYEIDLINANNLIISSLVL